MELSCCDVNWPVRKETYGRERKGGIRVSSLALKTKEFRHVAI